jgi:hypothetical protein
MASRGPSGGHFGALPLEWKDSRLQVGEDILKKVLLKGFGFSAVALTVLTCSAMPGRAADKPSCASGYEAVTNKKPPPQYVCQKIAAAPKKK